MARQAAHFPAVAGLSLPEMEDIESLTVARGKMDDGNEAYHISGQCVLRDTQGNDIRVSESTRYTYSFETRVLKAATNWVDIPAIALATAEAALRARGLLDGAP